MFACPTCGFSNLPEARFCSGCGASLEDAPPAREVRKTVTVIFCDVTGSTALGERLDPESLRHVMARYFEAMRAVIERHGGTVEKFIGDAVMAVFGVPVIHEDDALRAVRAAAEMREALTALNEELEHDYGTTLEARIGVNTGEVVTGTEERLATGDAVNVAARLEQAAPPGEILLGHETMRLVRDGVRIEELAPLELKGKAGSVGAYRLLSVEAEAPARRSDVPIVGRQRELRLLADAWERVTSERACALFTILGAAGVGKSRLAAELLAASDATVLVGRCPSYGEGITYFPVTEVVLQLGALGRELSAGPLAGLVGETATPTSPEEIAFSFRQLLEATARERPLLVVFDDIHWGEPAFLGLVEHVATMSRGAPILLLCMARPELLDRRPSWGGGLLNATTVLLEPLSADETDELIASLGTQLDDELAGRIRTAAEGNPLFVAEMLAMVEESGGNEVVVPPTVHALLTARLDQLDGDERGVLERGAVEGQVFHRGAVQALSDGEVELSPRLAALVRKELVRPDTAVFAGDDAYRFRHILIRDAAYDALPKATRAELHERFAGWLDAHGTDLIESDEIIGYHLEQAFRYRSELGPVDEAAREVGNRAADRLTAAGQGAILRGDVHAAASLLGRAVHLPWPDDSDRVALLLQLVRVLFETAEFERAERLIDEAAAAAAKADDDVGAARADLERVLLSTLVGGQLDLVGPALDRLEALADLFERSGEREDAARTWAYTGRIRFYQGRCDAADAAFDRAIALAGGYGSSRDERGWEDWRLAAKRYGSTPVPDAIACMDAAIAEVAGAGVPSPTTAFHQASLLAMAGEVEAARELFERTVPEAPAFGLVAEVAIGMEGGYLLELIGELERAEAVLRRAWEMSGRVGETGFRSTVGGQLAEVLVAQGRDADAADVLAEVDTFISSDDFEPQSRIRWVRATVLARQGRFEKAEALAREAAAVVDETDYLDQRGDAHRALAGVLALAGRESEAESELRTALELYERKGNVVRAAQVRERLA